MSKAVLSIVCVIMLVLVGLLAILRTTSDEIRKKVGDTPPDAEEVIFDSVEELNAFTFREVTSNEAKTLVDFYAPWCGPCRQMAPIIQKLKDAGYRVYKVNTDQQGALGNAQKPPVRSLPTIIVYEGGLEKKRFVGSQTYSTLEKELKP